MRDRSSRVVWVVGFVLVAAVFGLGCDRSDSTEASAESPSSGGQGAAAKSEQVENEGTQGEADEQKEVEEESAGAAENAAARLPEVEAQKIDGGTATLAADAPATLINLWATWCAPCLAEMPDISELHRDWEEEGLRTVALSIESNEAEDKVAGYVDENEPAFKVLFAPKTSPLKTFGAGSVPATFLYDGKGELVWSRDGKLTEGDFDSLRGEIESLLGE